MGVACLQRCLAPNLSYAGGRLLDGRRLPTSRPPNSFPLTACKIFLLMIPGLYVVPLFVAFAATGVVLMLLCILAYGYVYGRLLIWLPAVAVDDRLTFWEAWAVSGGNGFRLLGVVWGLPCRSSH